MFVQTGEEVLHHGDGSLGVWDAAVSLGVDLLAELSGSSGQIGGGSAGGQEGLVLDSLEAVLVFQSWDQSLPPGQVVLFAVDGDDQGALDEEGLVLGYLKIFFGGGKILSIFSLLYLF